jgi:hypothetical protein
MISKGVFKAMMSKYELFHNSSHNLVKLTLSDNDKGRINIQFDCPKENVFKRISFKHEELKCILTDKSSYTKNVSSKTKGNVSLFLIDDSYPHVLNLSKKIFNLKE